MKLGNRRKDGLYEDFFAQFKDNSPGIMFWKVAPRQIRKLIEPQVERVGWAVRDDIKERMRTPEENRPRGA